MRWLKAKHPYRRFIPRQTSRLLEELPKNHIQIWFDIIESFYEKLYDGKFKLDPEKTTYSGDLEKLLEAFKQGIVTRPLIVAYPQNIITEWSHQRDIAAHYLANFTGNQVQAKYNILGGRRDIFSMSPSKLCDWMSKNYKPEVDDQIYSFENDEIFGLILQNLDERQGFSELEFLTISPLHNPNEPDKNKLQLLAEKGMEFLSYEQVVLLMSEAKMFGGKLDINRNGEQVGHYHGPTKDKKSYMIGRVFEKNDSTLQISPYPFDPNLLEAKHFVI